MSEPISIETVISVITSLGARPNLSADQDFYEAGLSSVQALPLLLDLEDRFGVSIPDDRFMQTRTASSVVALLIDIQN